MMQTILRLAVLSLLALLPVSVARADQLTFWMMSDYDYEIAVEFSSSDDRFWPGDGLSWTITDYEEHSYVLNCEAGESICFGAWVPDGDLRWGVGYRRDRHCEECCYTCGGNTETGLINLVDYAD
jgi:hypothetical protein